LRGDIVNAALVIELRCFYWIDSLHGLLFLSDRAGKAVYVSDLNRVSMTSLDVIADNPGYETDKTEHMESFIVQPASSKSSRSPRSTRQQLRQLALMLIQVWCDRSPSVADGKSELSRDRRRLVGAGSLSFRMFGGGLFIAPLGQDLIHPHLQAME
jgi:hypothetical protein